jgi:hypothetical protein
MVCLQGRHQLLVLLDSSAGTWSISRSACLSVCSSPHREDLYVTGGVFSHLEPLKY